MYIRYYYTFVNQTVGSKAPWSLCLCYMSCRLEINLVLSCLMKGHSYMSLTLGRLRPSKRLTRTQVLSQFAALHGGSLQSIKFFQASMGGGPAKLLFHVTYLFSVLFHFLCLADIKMILYTTVVILQLNRTLVILQLNPSSS